MAKLIREETKDGKELVDYAVGVLRDVNATERNRAWAADWLADRGFGKPQQAIDVTSGDMPIQGGIDLSGLSPAALEELAQLGAGPEPQADDVDDE